MIRLEKGRTPVRIRPCRTIELLTAGARRLTGGDQCCLEGGHIEVGQEKTKPSVDLRLPRVIGDYAVGQTADHDI